MSCCASRRPVRPGLFLLAFGLLTLIAAYSRAADPHIVVAEGEFFQPEGADGWRVTHQDDSYGSHTYGGMWMMNGGCLGANADLVGNVATQTITIPAAGKYRLWSKYQAPPYFRYLHRVEVVQNGKTVYSHVYGQMGVDRLWSFSGKSNELWWPWGVDHDAAESPKTMIDLQAGPATLRLIAEKQAAPAGDRFIDFLVLTTNPEDDYIGFSPYSVGSPFTNEAFAASHFYARFQNTSAKPAKLTISRGGHYQPQYGGASMMLDETAPGQWSKWVNIGPFCRLVHDEGLSLSLGGGVPFAVEFARDQAGQQVVGQVKANDGDTAIVPIDIAWKKDATVKLAQQHAAEILAAAKTWRGTKKPKQIAYFGAFPGKEKWVTDLKDVLGYNTILPDGYEQLQRDHLHAHVYNEEQIRGFAQQPTTNKARLRVLSFGDEISLGRINFQDAKLQARFLEWLKIKGIDPAGAQLTDSGVGKWGWYSNLFNEEERFAEYRAMTRLTKELFGADVLTGANYSPHHLALCYGPIHQWVDIFRQEGMSMFWAEDYIFSLPEVPQILSWMFAQMRCGTKYHKQPIHMYVMPHAPGQEPAFLRRNMLMSIGYGARHIDSFWVAPAERFTENYVGWNYRDTFKTVAEAIHDTAEVEAIQTGGVLRPAKVAVITGKATDFHEGRLMVPRASDPFTAQCKNAPEKVNQILNRKEQQMLYLALRQQQQDVDVITEDDVVDLDVLKQYQVVYFAGEWVDERIVPKLDSWIKAGGTFYACSGCGLRNQYDEPTTKLLDLLGVKALSLDKNAALYRTLLELPLMPAIDTLTYGEQKLPALGMKQKFQPVDAKVIGTWSDGSAAVTERSYGSGKAIAVGTLPGAMWMKSAVPVRPWARGGRHTIYSSTAHDPKLTELVTLGLKAKPLPMQVQAMSEQVEGTLIDHGQQHLLTMVNWSTTPKQGLVVRVALPSVPKAIRSIGLRQAIPFTYKEGIAEMKIDLADADYFVIER